MGTWSKSELRKIAEADDLQIAPSEDGVSTARRPDLVCRCRDALYARGYNGTKSRWYQAAVRRKSRSRHRRCR